MNPRVAAAKIIAAVLRQQGSLSSQLPPILAKLPVTERPLVQNLCYGSLRWYPRLNAYLELLLDKPLRSKDSDISALMLLGLYQLEYTRIPDHAAIGETAGAARALKKAWGTGLVNAILRRFVREKTLLDEQLANNPEFCSAHPQWLLDALTSAWPESAAGIIEANNAHPPFTLRVDTTRISREEYCSQLAGVSISAKITPFSTAGITLAQAVDPTELPGFTEGLISVQDEAAQLAAELLELAPGLSVLDACSAPGGKTGHMLQLQPALDVTALDSDARRLARVEENLQRLGAAARLIHGDAGEPHSWWNGQGFDRILLDAPCSGSGIIRRHSDIKVLRSATEITRLAALQDLLLQALWPLLKPGGLLLYATCSALPEENCQVIERFLSQTADAEHRPIAADWGFSQSAGRQLLPQIDGHDGFFYAKLYKSGKT
ncbi:MAG TPA: 16S rRNA (cytosine(967)-C(5))-methyltransferase RsmB [Cellvibrionaceae bacterium]